MIVDLIQSNSIVELEMLLFPIPNLERNFHILEQKEDYMF